MQRSGLHKSPDRVEQLSRRLDLGKVSGVLQELEPRPGYRLRERP
jgi:hypothetical protein